MLDMAAKIDATADYLCKAKWGDVEFPPPFGREAYPEVRGAACAACWRRCSVTGRSTAPPWPRCRPGWRTEKQRSATRRTPSGYATLDRKSVV